MAELNTFVVRDTVTIRDGILRVIRTGLIQRDVPTPNVTPGSDWYVLAQSVANQLTVAEANAIIKADENMPDTATEDALARICAIFGLSKQPAAGSVGSVVISSSQATTIATGDQLIDGAGLSYAVSTGGTYDDGDSVPIRAIDTGKDTNHAAEDILRWVSTPPFCDEKVEVGSGGLVNGIDEEDDEVLRGRLYAVLQSPPSSGNSEHVAELAEASTSSVQKAFPYPAIQGPASCHVAVTAAPTATSKSRDVASATMTGTVTPYVQGQLPEHVYSVITTVTNVDADVAFGLALPEAATANPPGPGGGWTDGTPWPAPDNSATFRCTVTAVTSTTEFTVDATSIPIANVSQICWLSPTEWKLYTALVTAVSGTSGAYVITLDQPFTGIATGNYIWPKCENAQAYCDAVLAAFALMGPGEKTSNASALVRGFRHPRSAAGWPMSLGTHLTRAVVEVGDEVESAQFFHRTDGTTTLTGSSGIVNPQVPASVTDPPKIFRPRYIAFYRVP
jgi:uncharacterized phage protein gp47/JayE